MNVISVSELLQYEYLVKRRQLKKDNLTAVKMEVREYGDFPWIEENPGLPNQPIVILAQAIEEQEEEEFVAMCLAAILSLIIMAISYGCTALLLAKFERSDIQPDVDNTEDFWDYVISDY